MRVKGRFVKGDGAPKGNRNSANHRRYRKALDKQLETLVLPEHGIQEGEALDAIAKQHVLDALSTDPDVRIPSRTELANRLDGKPKEHVELEYADRLESEMTDEELLAIIRGRDQGGEGAVETPAGAPDNSELH